MTPPVLRARCRATGNLTVSAPGAADWTSIPSVAPLGIPRLPQRTVTAQLHTWNADSLNPAQRPGSQHGRALKDDPVKISIARDHQAERYSLIQV